MDTFFRGKLGIGSVALISLIIGVSGGLFANNLFFAGDKAVGKKMNSFPQGQVLEIKYAEVTETIPFQTVSEQDPNLLAGNIQVRQEGSNGLSFRKYQIFMFSGSVLRRQLVSDVPLVQPVNRVEAVGAAPINVPLYGSLAGGSSGGSSNISPVDPTPSWQSQPRYGDWNERGCSTPSCSSPLDPSY